MRNENTSSLKKADLSKEKMRQFKRKALGPFRKKTIKTLNEMAQLLCSAEIVSSIKEGKEIAPLLVTEIAVIKYETYKALSFWYLEEDRRQYEVKAFPCSCYLE